MRILVKYLILNILLIYFCVGLPTLCLASETYQSGNLLFSDDFSTNLNNWKDELGTGGWSINAGNLLGVKTTAHTSGRLTSNLGNNWDNYSVEVDVNNNAGVDEGVGFRRLDLNNAYELNLRHGNGPYNTPQIILTKIQNGITTTLYETKSIPLANLKWYHLKVEVVGEHIQVSLDSSLIFETDDPGTTVKTGSVSLSFWTGDYGVSIIRFDNLKVTSLSKQFNPVIFMPGVGGSEFQTAQDIIWSSSDGHGGTYSHAYPIGEKVWVNTLEAAKPGSDDYFDVLRLKNDGVTSESSLKLTGTLVSFAYQDIDSFFQSLGYTKGVNFFDFPYDWRQDVRNTETDLDNLVETARQKSGMSQVNLVGHSMGGLVARNYIQNPDRAKKIGKFIGLGNPYLGSVKTLKSLMYGIWVGYDFGLFGIGITPLETRDIFQNITGGFSLLPSKAYFNFYNNSDFDHQYPFWDARDIDNNKQTGPLNYSQIAELLKNLSYNMIPFGIAEGFHNLFDANLNQNNNVKIYNIVGSGEPTIGQIYEGWLINWPLKLIPKYDETYINGDDTVPIYSATLKNDKFDLSAGSKLYYVNQEHTDLVNVNGQAMQILKSILNEGDSTSSATLQPSALDGVQVSVDQDANLNLYDSNQNHTGLTTTSDLEIKIPQTFFDTLGNTKQVFIKKSAGKITAYVSSPKTVNTNVKIRQYSADQISKTALYSNIPVSSTLPVTFSIDPTSNKSPILTAGNQTYNPTSEVEGPNLDFSPPETAVTISGQTDSSGSYTGQAIVSFTPTDNSSGVLNTLYSLDNGQTVHTYQDPLTITSPGETYLVVSSTDKVGNQESPRSMTITISNPTFTPTPGTEVVKISQIGNNQVIDQTPTKNPVQTNFKLSKPTSNILGVKALKQSWQTGERNRQKIPDENTQESGSKRNIILLIGIALVLGIIPVVSGLLLKDRKQINP